MDSDNIKIIEKILGYTFIDKSLLKVAFTHSSYSNLHPGNESYERLEFIGDSVVGLIVANSLYNRYPNFDQGYLSKIRSKIITNKSFSEEIEKLNLEQFLLTADSIKENISAKLKGDLFEALVGAIFIDSGDLAECTKFVIRNLSVKLNAIYNIENITDYKSALFEYAAKNNIKLEFISEQLDTSVFVARAFINGEYCAQGEGNSKKAAEQNAAQNVNNLHKFDKEN